MSSSEKLEQVVSIFNSLFRESENTLLQGGQGEPFYRAEVKLSPAIIFFREDFLSSALHEVAHWCIAGKERRQKDDFGYWYQPDGRSLERQKEFEQVEIKPQALEWIFSLACKHQFNFSADNLSQDNQVSDSFKQNVIIQLSCYLKNDSLPKRAEQFFQQLSLTFSVTNLKEIIGEQDLCSN